MTSGRRETELAHVAAFLATIGLEAEIEPLADGQGPDYLVRRPGAHFGIEHTRLYQEPNPGRPPRRQLEGVRDQILRRAETVWMERFGLPVEVHCHFDLGHLPAKADIPEVVERLVAYVSLNLPLEGRHTFVERDWSEPHQLPRSILALSMYHAAKLIDSHWVAPDGGLVPDLEPTVVQARIDAKAGKYATYTAAVPEVWLLMVLEGHRVSGTFGLEGSVTECSYRSPFARNYLFEAFSRAPILLTSRGNHADPAV